MESSCFVPSILLEMIPQYFVYTSSLFCKDTVKMGKEKPVIL